MSGHKSRRARQSITVLDTLAEVSGHHSDISDSVHTSVNYDRQRDTPSGNIIQNDEVRMDHYLVQGEKRIRRDEPGMSINNTVLQSTVH